LKSAAQNRGYRARPITDIKTLAGAMTTLREDFPNFVQVLDVLEAALALSIEDSDFTIPSLLVHGEPGIGKTTFSMAIADRLGMSFDMVSAGSLQGSFDLAGTSSHWSNASAGRVARLLAESHSASPVLLIDEVDKVGGEERYSPVNTLLDLLEPRTASRFRDEALQLQFDASRMIVIMTANDLRSIPAPLLSRAQVIAIEPMSAEQRFAIVRKLVDKHAGELAIDDETIERIGTSGDLRKLQQVIKKAAGLAKARGDSALFFSILANESQPNTERRIGF
jgi:ATP-dependent Lon protease